MSTLGFPKISFWRTIVAVIFAAGLYSMYARFGLGFPRRRSSNPSYPCSS